MKKASKSKDRDKNKHEEQKTQRITRKRRKSESSGSESDSCKKNDHDDKRMHTDSPKTPTEKESDNVRSTRHSRRLAVSSDDNAKEEKSISLTLKIGRTNSKDNSPYKESKKKETVPVENSKHKMKEADVWKVKSSNGKGAGEIQKLKICRQRTPEPNEINENKESTDTIINEIADDSPSVNDVNNQNENEPSASISTNDNSYHDQVETENVSDICLPPNPEVQSLSSPVPNTDCNLPSEDVPNKHDEPVETDNVQPVDEIALPDSDTEKSAEIVSDTNNEKEFSNDSNSGDGTKSSLPENSNNEIQVDHKSSSKSVENETCDNPVQEEIQTSVEETTENDQKITPVEEEDSGQSNSNSEENVEYENSETVDQNLPSEKKSVSDEVVIALNDEEYDYDENDDTKEEGEISGNESLSPTHQLFKKLPKEDRVREWGHCTVFTFSKTTLISTEDILKEHQIEKILPQKDVLYIESDTDDLIFVKEIREENVIHEVEPEMNKHMKDESVKIRDKEQEVVDDEDDDINMSNAQDIKITFDNESAFSQDADGDVNHNKHIESRKDSKRNYKISPSRKSSKDEKNSSRLPAKKPEESILYISNLVRPFTLSQLKELLQRTGKIARDGFWIDSIKSKCYVQYESIDQAIETKHALNGIHWPLSNPKCLHVQYATRDDLLKAQTQADVSEMPRKNETFFPDNRGRRVERYNRRKLSETYDDEHQLKINIGVREWDIGKPKNPDEMTFPDEIDPKNATAETKSKEKPQNKRPHNKNATSSEEVVAQPVKKPKKTEGKMLDDLFRRTKATPSIYWLPLNDEQIAEKDALRRKQLEIIKERMSKNHDEPSRSKGDDRNYRNARRRIYVNNRTMRRRRRSH